jgi:predicted MPP superfamily phosphohydrolase
MNKVFLTTDWHFGVYANTNLEKWLKMMEDYYYNFFIPYIKQNAKPGDILIHMGDLYDNRNSIPIIVMNKAESILLELSKILELHIMVGNHDLWNKGSNDVNSIKLFDWIPNINVYTKPHTIDFNGQKLVLIPWVERRLDLINEIKSNPGDYLFCHSDLNGCRMHLNSIAHRNPDKINVEDFSGYKHVFSGHIHIRQTNNNFTFIGSPYQMDRNDMNNDKGITILHPHSGEVDFHLNDYSPVFKKVSVIQEDDLDLLEGLNMKDYIDIKISNSLLVGNRKFRRKLESILETGNFASVEYVDDLIQEKVDSEELSIETEAGELDFDFVGNIDFSDMIKDYINKQKWDNEEVKSGVMSEFDNVVKIYEGGYKNK